MTNNALLERLLSRMAPEPTSGCWLWLGGTDSSGYGSIRVGDKTKSTHRLSYELHRGPIPDGLRVCHKCDVPSCINPDHFFLGTDADNAHDRDRKGRLVPAPPMPGQAHANAKLSDADVLEMRRRVSSGVATPREEAQRLGITFVAACKILRGAAWSHLPGAEPMRRRSWKKRMLSAAEVREIRRRYAAGGVTQAELAKEYGAGKSNIQRICRRPEDPRC